MIRIGYFGDGPWASRVLDHIAARTDMFTVAFIAPRFDTQDPDLKKWAEKLSVPFIAAPNVNDPAFIAQIAALECDLLVSMSFNQILKAPIRDLTRLGFINCHAGALPFYRGRNPLNWALINDEKELGVTVHYVDEGIDTGDIIVRRMTQISDADDYATLLDKAYYLCADVLLEALEAIAAGNVPRVKQDTIDPVGFYCGRRRAGDEVIDWRKGSRALFNFIRAITVPGPCAQTSGEAGHVAIIAAREIPGAPCYTATPGEVVGRSAEGAVVKTGDSTILVTRAALIESGCMGAPFVPQWRIGTRLAVDVQKGAVS
jgi:methionyl-tRNA formyltransferase